MRAGWRSRIDCASTPACRAHVCVRQRRIPRAARLGLHGFRRTDPARFGADHRERRAALSPNWSFTSKFDGAFASRRRPRPALAPSLHVVTGCAHTRVAPMLGSWALGSVGLGNNLSSAPLLLGWMISRTGDRARLSGFSRSLPTVRGNVAQGGFYATAISVANLEEINGLFAFTRSKITYSDKII